MPVICFKTLRKVTLFHHKELKQIGDNRGRGGWMASLTQGIFQARVLEWVAIAFSDPYQQVVPKDPRQHGLFASPSFPHISPHCTLLPLRKCTHNSHIWSTGIDWAAAWLRHCVLVCLVLHMFIIHVSSDYKPDRWVRPALLCLQSLPLLPNNRTGNILGQQQLESLLWIIIPFIIWSIINLSKICRAKLRIPVTLWETLVVWSEISILIDSCSPAPYKQMKYVNTTVNAYTLLFPILSLREKAHSNFTFALNQQFKN